MIYRIITSFVFLFIASFAVAQTPMDATEFDRKFTGKTMHYELNGKPFGAEQYLPNRRVRWSISDGKCQTGEWYPDGNLICFVYDGDPDPKCWSFSQTPNGIAAIFENDPTQTILHLIKESTEPLMCLGPEVGV